MCRAAKDRAGTVIHHDKIGDVNGQFPACIKRMAHAQTSVETHFFGCFDLFGGGATFAAILIERQHLGVIYFKLFGERMVW